jgi:hypothetical protein
MSGSSVQSWVQTALNDNTEYAQKLDSIIGECRKEHKSVSKVEYYLDELQKVRRRVMKIKCRWLLSGILILDELQKVRRRY